MTEEKLLTIIEAWDRLNEVNNEIDLLETQIVLKLDIAASKLRDILTSCSFTNNEKFINGIVNKDEKTEQLIKDYQEKSNLEKYIQNEIKRTKISQPALCIAFLKEYSLNKDNTKLTWDDIEKEMGMSKRQCQRNYEEYLKLHPSNKQWAKINKK